MNGLKCTCDTTGLISRCVRHDALRHAAKPLDQFPALIPAIREQNRIIEASANLTPTKACPAAPFSGPPGGLFALTYLIDTQPTTEQWQTLKRLILSLERT